MAEFVSFAAVVRPIVHLLVTGDYKALDDQRLVAGDTTISAEDIARTVHEYGARLIDLPDEAFAHVYVHMPDSEGHFTRDFRNATLAEVAQHAYVTLYLWTAEEGRSGMGMDLCVQAAGDHPVQIRHFHGVPLVLHPILRDVVHQLVVSNYEGLIADGRAAGWTVDILRDIVTEIEGSEGHLIDLPADVFQENDVHVYSSYDGSGWAVDCCLWTETGMSVYTLKLDVQRTASGYAVDIEDIEVL